MLLLQAGLELDVLDMLTRQGLLTIVFYFSVYSFFGWLLENSYSFFTRRVFFKNGFFWGPFKPMYGIAPVLLILLLSEGMNWIFVIFLCFFIPTTIEYVTGVLLEAFFQRRWWDYSHMRFQLHGHICLSFSLCWIFLAILCLKLIHPIVAHLYGLIVPYWTMIVPIVVLYFMVETIFSIRKHASRRLTLVKPVRAR